MDSSVDNYELLTVIIPVYNTVDTVERTVQSVINQTWKNIEIIIVDDGSPDEAGKICDRLAEKNRIITVIHKENAGLGYARNSGLEVATGHYVAFLDSDDWVEPDAYEICIRQMQIDGSSVCYFGRKVYNVNGDYSVVKAVPDKLYYSGEEVIEGFAIKYFGDFNSQTDKLYIRESACCAIYDRTIIKENNIGFLSERVCLSEDIFFNLDICRYAKGVSIIPKDIYNQGYNTNSLTKKRDSKRLDKIKLMYFHLLEYAKKYPEIEDKYQRIYYRVISYIRGLIRDEAIVEDRFVDVLAFVKSVVNDLVLEQVYSAILVEQLDDKSKTFIKWLRNKSVFKISAFYRIKGRIKH